MSAKKKWFDDWNVTKYYKDRGRVSIDVKLPHAYGVQQVHFRSTPDHRVRWLVEVLDCALTELSQRRKRS